MSGKPVISVVFPTHNRPDEVARTLSLLRQNMPVDYEVTILDNSPEPARHALEKNETCVVTGSNLGTAARNIGIETARAPFVLMLDDDSHPLPGSIAAALRELDGTGPEIGGLTGPISRPDGGLENPPLLPTTFHGCGALFKTSALRQTGKFYPEDFCFYGEEYWSTLKFYACGFKFKFSEEFKVCHRMCASGRDVARILYRLTVNNRRTWPPFAPPSYLERAMTDTTTRYELISQKEGVPEAYAKAMAEEITIPGGLPALTERQFEDFSLVAEFKKLAASGGVPRGRGVVLCGAGKFPTIWAGLLLDAGAGEALIADFNPGIAGKNYGGFQTTGPDEALAAIRKGFTAVCGHSARADTANWLSLLEKAGVSSLAILPES